MITDLIRRETIAEIVELYQNLVAQTTQAIELLAKADNTLRYICGPTARIFPYYNKITTSLSFENGENIKKDALGFIKRQTWKAIAERTEITRMMAISDKQKFEKQLLNDTLPDITEDNVWQFIQNLCDDLPQLFEKNIIEVFDWLRPPTSSHKTNSTFEVNEKVIVKNVVELFISTWYLHDSEQNILALDNVMHLLDGKGCVKYPGDLLTTILNAMKKNLTQCQTQYFNLKWCKNGNMHIQFTNLKLLQEFNRIGGKGRNQLKK